MNKDIQEQLIALNHRFYRAHADSFSATRGKLQNGVLKLTDSIPPTAAILDLGCGNGQFLAYLIKHGFTGKYVGVDFSHALLAKAEEVNRSQMGTKSSYFQADITNKNWVAPLGVNKFSTITAFAVLHHIPNNELRQNLLKQIFDLLDPDAYFYLSVWQFQNSPRLRKRILPWEQIGLDKTDVEEGDALLDWRADVKDNQVGLRYAHLFSEEELTCLRDKSGFTLKHQFYSDGKEGNLALYQIWQKS